MADDAPKPITPRRQHLLSFVPKAARADMLRLFAMIDESAPAITKTAPPPEPKRKK